MTSSLAVGVDIGGTKIAAGLVEDGQVRLFREVATPAGADAVVESVAALVEEFPAAPVGVAVAGFLSSDRTAVTYAPNLEWIDVPLQAILRDQTGREVVIENDANAAAWGEYRYGAGRDAHTLVAVTVGTGIGGGIVINGSLFAGAHGVGAELGHIQVVSARSGGTPRWCGCGSRGCWEMYGSGSALDRAGVAAGFEDGRAVIEAASGGDPQARALVAELTGWLGEGLASVSAVLDPDVIVVGGGVAEAGMVVMDPLIAAYHEVVRASHRPEADVRVAALSNRAGLIGAADLAHP